MLTSDLKTRTHAPDYVNTDYCIQACGITLTHIRKRSEQGIILSGKLIGWDSGPVVSGTALQYLSYVISLLPDF